MNDETRIFEAETLEKAMRMVHKTFGPGASILRTRYLRTGGILGIGSREVVQITASPKPSPASRRRLPGGPASGPEDIPSENRPLPGPETPGQAASLVSERYRSASRLRDEDEDLRSELRSIRLTLKRLQQAAAASGGGAALREALIRAGFCDEDVDLVSQKTLDHATMAELRTPELLARRAVETLKTLIKVRPGLETADGTPKTYALVGPTGSGKTTTIAKLAAIYKLKRGMKVAVASIDNFRVGAAEQIRRYAAMLDVPLQFVSDPKEARSVKERFRSSDIILVDTTGRAPQDGLSLSEMALLLKEIGPDEVFLTAEAGILGERAGRIITAFGRLLPITRTVITKVDEVPLIGGALSVSMRLSAPVAYLTTGQNVPDDIRSAGANSIGRLLEEALRPAQTA